MSQVDGVSNKVPACQLCGEGLIRGAVAPVRTSVWEKAAPPALALMLDSPAPSHVFSASQAAVPVLEITGSESESMCRPFKRNCLGLQKPSTSASTVGFYSQKLGQLLVLALEPWAGGLLYGWDPLLLRGGTCSRAIPPDFCLPHMGVGPALSTPSITLDVAASSIP